MTSAGRKSDEGNERRKELSRNSLSIAGFAQPQSVSKTERWFHSLNVCRFDGIMPILQTEEELDVLRRKLAGCPLQNF